MSAIIKELQKEGYTVVKELYNVIRLTNGTKTKMVLFFNNTISIDTYNI